MSLPTTGPISAATFNTDAGLAGSTTLNMSKIQSGNPIWGYSATAYNEADGASYTFSSVSIGTEAADRKVIVGIVCDAVYNASYPSISSCTIGGVTATQVRVASAQSASNGPQSVIVVVEAVVPTGTTASIVVNYSRTVAFCGIMVFNARNLGPVDQVATSNYYGMTNGVLNNLRTTNNSSLIVFAWGPSQGTAWTFSANLLKCPGNDNAAGRTYSAGINGSSSHRMAVSASNTGSTDRDLVIAVGYYPASSDNGSKFRKVAVGENNAVGGPISFSDLYGKTAKWGGMVCKIVYVSASAANAKPLVAGTNAGDPPVHDGFSGYTFDLFQNGYDLFDTIDIHVDISLASGQRLYFNSLNNTDYSGRTINFGDGVFRAFPTPVAGKFGGYTYYWSDAIASTINSYYQARIGQTVTVEIV